MKLKTPFTALLFVFFSITSFGQYLHENLKIMRLKDYSYENIESPEKYDISYTYKNLRLFPIVANKEFKTQHENIGNFLLLKDAIQQKKIIIKETGADTPQSNNAQINSENQTQNEPILEQRQENQTNSQRQIQTQNISQNQISGGIGGTVNKLIAKNTSSDTIFIMAGEVVKGGKQDRVIAKDIVLSPGQEVDLSAFCVEKNRWSTKENNKGQFTGYYNVSSMDIRKVVTEDANQSKVWSTVDEHTKSNKASSSTSTYTNLENSKEYQDKIKGYMKKFENLF